jgi:acetyltransferase
VTDRPPAPESPPLEGAPRPYPVELERHWRPAGGPDVLIRPLRSDDVERELRFIEALSPQTLYLRLQYAASQPTRRDVERLLDLDYHDRIALGAIVPAPPDDVLVGVCRYARIVGTERAECAIVVADGWQGRGLGTELMRSLTQAARARGVHVLEGTALADNLRLTDWARRFGFDARTEPHSGGLVRVTIDLGSVT